LSKDNLIPEEAKPVGSLNFHLRKYSVYAYTNSRIAKKEELWSILSGSSTFKSKKRVSDDSPNDDSEEIRLEHLMYSTL